MPIQEMLILGIWGKLLTKRQTGKGLWCMSTMINILIIASIILIAAAIGVVIWRVISTKRFPAFICLFLILPVGQLFMLHSFKFETWSVFWVVGVLLGLLGSISLLIYAISQEKKTAAQEELKAAQHKMALEKAHYSAIEKRREQLTEIRKDFSEQLKAVSQLIGYGNEKYAHEMIADFAGKISMTRENPFCSIPVINAVLMEKEKICKDAGIELYVNLNIPNPIDVSPMHLCSIFSNILDNAINACRKVQETKNDRLIISLSSKVDGDYLFIKAKNPSEKPYFSASGKGYGLKILNDIAKRYSGAFQSNYHEGIYTVFISLLSKE